MISQWTCQRFEMARWTRSTGLCPARTALSAEAPEPCTHISFSLNSPKQGAMNRRIYVLYPAKQFKSHNELFVYSQQDWSDKGIWIVWQYFSTTSL